MKHLDWQYELHVFGTSKKALSLEDFAELAKKLAGLLGSRDHVHFGALRDGSAKLLAKVEEPALQAVEVQLLRAKNDEGPAAGKVVNLNEYLGLKGWRAELKNSQGGVVLNFPGALNKPTPEPVQTVHQNDSLVGQVIKIGGRDETVPMTIKTPDGAFVDVTVKGREQAKKLAQHLFGNDVKLTGNATWTRDEEGHWSCSDMEVLSFEELETTSLVDLFESLRQVPDNHWHQVEDPIAEWKKQHREDH
uniref:Uncharacterized protein n=1 Tax=Variovorax paradoxus (strain S110) TaxID=543728 RepID=C5CUY2_VARPS